MARTKTLQHHPETGGPEDSIFKTAKNSGKSPTLPRCAHYEEHGIDDEPVVVSLPPTKRSSSIERSNSDQKLLKAMSTFTEDEIESTLFESRKHSNSADDINLLDDSVLSEAMDDEDEDVKSLIGTSQIRKNQAMSSSATSTPATESEEDDDIFLKFDDEEDFAMWPEDATANASPKVISRSSAKHDNKSKSNHNGATSSFAKSPFSPTSFLEGDQQPQRPSRLASSTVHTHLSETHTIKSTIDGAGTISPVHDKPINPVSRIPPMMGQADSQLQNHRSNRRGALMFSTKASSTSNMNRRPGLQDFSKQATSMSNLPISKSPTKGSGGRLMALTKLGINSINLLGFGNGNSSNRGGGRWGNDNNSEEEMATMMSNSLRMDANAMGDTGGTGPAGITSSRHRRSGSTGDVPNNKTMISPATGEAITTTSQTISLSPITPRTRQYSPARNGRRATLQMTVKDQQPSTPRSSEPSNFRKRMLMQKASALLPDFDAMHQDLKSPQTPTTPTTEQQHDRPPTSSQSSSRRERRARQSSSNGPHPKRERRSSTRESSSEKQHRRRSGSRQRKGRGRHASESPAPQDRSRKSKRRHRRETVSESPARGVNGRRVLNIKITKKGASTPSPMIGLRGSSSNKLSGMLEGDQAIKRGGKNNESTVLSPSSQTCATEDKTLTTTESESPVPTVGSNSQNHRRLPPKPADSNNSNNKSYRTQRTEGSGGNSSTASSGDEDIDTSNRNRPRRGSLSLSTDATDLTKLNLSPKQQSLTKPTIGRIDDSEWDLLTASPRQPNPTITLGRPGNSPSNRSSLRTSSPSPLRGGKRLAALCVPILSPLPGTESPTKTKQPIMSPTPPAGRKKQTRRGSMDSGIQIPLTPSGDNKSSRMRRQRYGSDNICAGIVNGSPEELQGNAAKTSTEISWSREKRNGRRRSSSVCLKANKSEEKESEVRHLTRRHSSTSTMRSSRSSDDEGETTKKAESNSKKSSDNTTNRQHRSPVRSRHRQEEGGETESPTAMSKRASKQRERQSRRERDQDGPAVQGEPQLKTEDADGRRRLASSSSRATRRHRSGSSSRKLDDGKKSPSRSRNLQSSESKQERFSRRKRGSDIDEPEMPSTIPFRENSTPGDPESSEAPDCEEGTHSPRLDSSPSNSRKNATSVSIDRRGETKSSPSKRKLSSESPTKQRRTVDKRTLEESIGKMNRRELNRVHSQSKLLCEIKSAGGSVAGIVEDRKASRRRRPKRQSREESSDKRKSEREGAQGHGCGAGERRSQERRSRRATTKDNKSDSRERKPSSERRKRSTRECSRPRSSRRLNV